MKTTIPILFLLVLCGCGPGYTYSPYIGQQQNWVTTPSAYTKLVDGVTLYPPGQYPNRPYIILGGITTDNEDNLAKAVREQHADAAIISSSRVYNNGSVAVAGPGVVWAEPLRHSVVTANLIKFRM
jgi:hypothetical protein